MQAHNGLWLRDVVEQVFSRDYGGGRCGGRGSRGKGRDRGSEGGRERDEVKEDGFHYI